MTRFLPAALLAAAISGCLAAKPERHRSQAYPSSGTPRTRVGDEVNERLLAAPDEIYLGMASRELEDKSMPLNDELQHEDDPCAIPFEDATRTVPWTNGTSIALFRSDYLESCYESLTVDSDNMVEHVSALNVYFEQYYCFYNIAKDPGASVPREHQPELGYEIWQEGTVDIGARLEGLAKDIESNGASLATFWDIQEVFNGLRDGHVKLPKTPPPFGGYTGGSSYLISERTLKDGLLVNPTVSYVSLEGSGPELTLKVSTAESNQNGAETEGKTVKTMNGQSVLTFLLEIANKRCYPQAEGSRFNHALTFLGIGYQRYLANVTGLEDMRPSSLFPERFEVTYTDGTSEEYYHLIGFNGTTAESAYEYFSANKTRVEENINRPGAAYMSFKEMEGKIVSAKDATAEPARRLEQQNIFRQLETDEDDQSYPWDFEDTVNKAAYKITDNYAVLKMQSFSVQPDFVIDLWANFTRAAKAKGIRKAMIDLSYNGGGIIPAGDMLTLSLYPKVSYDWFSEQYDQAYNDGMAAWNTYVVPLLNEIVTFLNNASDQDLQTFLDGITPDQETIFLTAALSLRDFCITSGLNDKSRCLPFISLEDSIETLLDFPSGPQMRALLESLVSMLTANNYNPFSTGNAQAYDWSVVRTLNRGGVEQNLTSRYTLTTKDQYNAAVASALQIGHSFDEYLLVSNGVAASTTDIFASGVMQLWNNRDRSGVTTPIKGITYGGTPDPKATSLASVPANVLDGISVESNIVAYTVLFLLSSLLPENSTDYAEFTSQLADAKEAFRMATPIPPYFAYSFPNLPIRNYYSKFMGGLDALPLQYVTIPATDHMQQIYRFTSFDHSHDLQALYADAAKFFAQDQANTSRGEGKASSGASRSSLIAMGLSIFLVLLWQRI